MFLHDEGSCQAMASLIIDTYYGLRRLPGELGRIVATPVSKHGLPGRIPSSKRINSTVADRTETDREACRSLSYSLYGI